MYKNRFAEYVKAGLVAGLLTAVSAAVAYFLLSMLFNVDVHVIGQDRDTLYVVFVAFASFISVLVGTLLFFLLQKWTNKPLIWLSVFVILGFFANTFSAETSLDPTYKITAHLLHVLVVLMAIYLIPRGVRK